MEVIMLGELNREQTEQVLRSEVIGRIGCHSGGKTYVVPVTYAYFDGAVYGHSGPGMKLEMMRANPEVCFEVDDLENLSNWRSVIAWGRFEELHGEAAMNAMQKLADRLMPMMASETSQPHGSGGTGASQAVVYRINLREMTGRFEKR
jgi:nitroimidazol reductase NimA-like FMN-containing flavoprotein (pyridoxamine 5'-phosphate oxidase superfamily)